MTHTAPSPKTCPDCACQQQCLLGRQNEAVRKTWAPFITERRFRKGETLLRQDDAHAVFQVIKIGTLVLQRSGEDGVNRPIGMAGCGQALGMPALLGQPSEMSCVAVMPGRLCEVQVPAAVRGGLLTPEFLRDLVREQIRAHARQADWARLMHVRGVTGQLAATLLQLADIQRSTLVRLPSHTVLAALLATTRETIARALAVLARQNGVIRHDRWHCAIVREQLVDLSRGGRQLPRAPRPVATATAAPAEPRAPAHASPQPACPAPRLTAVPAANWAPAPRAARGAATALPA